MAPSALLNDLKAIVGDQHVSAGASHTELYAYDASLAKGKPNAVVFPADARETAKVVRCAFDHGVPFVPRGFGTNLSGGTVLPTGGLVICLSRLNRILGIYPERRTAVVQPGVTNLELQNALGPHGFFFAPDPASQKVATLGGNVGENSGGPRCLKYGVTTNHLLGMACVLPDGTSLQLGGEALDPPGYDLRGVLVGSEGTFGIATELTVRILPLPENIVTLLAIYDDVAQAAHSVSGIISAGMIPATLEMMDALIIQAVEDSYACGYPRDAAAVLIIEVEGLTAGLGEQARKIETICMRNGCRHVRRARDEAERSRLWEGRRGAFGAVARLAPNFMVNDCSVPRTKLPEALAKVAEIAARYGFRHGNVFHAGDGNLHPLLLFDSRDKGQMTRVKKAGWEIMVVCAELGGTVSGEHGIGVEKREAMHLVFSEHDLASQRSLKKVFDPGGVLNPEKVIPGPRSRAQGPAPENHGPKAMEGSMAQDSPGERRLAVRIQEAVELRQAILPVGCGTRIRFGNRPEKPLLSMNTTALNAIIDLDPQNQTVCVESGMPLAELQQHLGAHRQWLPIRPPTALGGHSVGGMSALGACGPERLAYGAPRDLLLGLRFVSGKGRLISTGGRVVKNVTGYDMTRLMAGSAGTLGVITRLTLRITMLPERCVTLSGRGGVENCKSASTTLMTSAVEPAHVTAAPVGAKCRSAGEWRLTVGFEGLSKTIDQQLPKARTIMEAAGLEVEAPEDYHALEGPFSRIYASLDGYAFLLNGHYPLNRLWDTVLSLADILVDMPIFLDLGCGRLMASGEDLDAHGWDRICRTSEISGGHVLLEKAPEAFKEKRDVFGPYRLEWDIMHAIKAALDPHGIFAPGKLPGKR